jgi:mevalonate kinase
MGFAKVILLGEHAVVYGHAALAAALDRGLHCSAQPGEYSLAVPEWSLLVKASEMHPVAAALRTIAAALGTGDPAVQLTARAEIPPGAGLGSSAALAVAITRALAANMNKALTHAELMTIAGRSEEQFHHNPSGIDVALAAGGGAGLFRRTTGLVPLRAGISTLAIGLSGEPRSTSDMVERVARATAQRPDDARLVLLGNLAEAGAEQLASGDLPGLGEAMNRAHDVLRNLGVSTPILDEMVATARAAGALGAKLTGGGGGGAVIALAPGREDAVLAAWQRHHREGFCARLGPPAEVAS